MKKGLLWAAIGLMGLSSAANATTWLNKYNGPIKAKLHGSTVEAISCDVSETDCRSLSGTFTRHNGLIDINWSTTGEHACFRPGGGHSVSC